MRYYILNERDEVRILGLEFEVPSQAAVSTLRQLVDSISPKSGLPIVCERPVSSSGEQHLHWPGNPISVAVIASNDLLDKTRLIVEVVQVVGETSCADQYRPPYPL